jgi:hypothetical protein
VSLVGRPYAGEGDLRSVIELLSACQRAGYVDMEFRSIELRLALRDPTFDRERFIALFERPRGNLLAFAILWRGRFLGMLVHPQARGRLEDEVIRWAVKLFGRPTGIPRQPRPGPCAGTMTA